MTNLSNDKQIPVDTLSCRRRLGYSSQPRWRPQVPQNCD